MIAKIQENAHQADYASAISKYEVESLPAGQSQWIDRAREVAHILAIDAVKRESELKSPFAEVALLKSAGLLKVLGPKRYGGGGETWETGYKVIREIAKGDGSLGMLLGYHLLWSTTANVVGTLEQQAHVQQIIIENNYFIGGAVNPRDDDLKITLEGDDIVFDGFKNFSTGGVISDLTVLEGVLDGTDEHIFTFVKTKQPGIQFAHNWDAVGLRLTESGSVRIDHVRVPWSDALGWDSGKRKPDPNILGIPFSTMLLPTIQLVFSNFYLGIALGALDAASSYTRDWTRAWPYGGDDKDRAIDEWYILERYGGFKAHLNAAETLCNEAGARVAQIYSRTTRDVSASGREEDAVGATNAKRESHSGRTVISANDRGQVAAYVASAKASRKIVTTDTSLAVTSGIFEMLGSRATGRKYGFDRFWRDVRTHSLHDPVAYKRREVGRWALLNEIPEPTWYT